MFEKAQATPSPKITIKKNESGETIAVIGELIRIKNLDQICVKLQEINCDYIEAPGCSIFAAELLRVRGITCL